MAFGAKIGLSVDKSKASAFRKEIQSFVDNSTGKTPVYLKNVQVTADSKKSLLRDLEKSLNSGDKLTVKVGNIDASGAIKNLRDQLETMLSGLSITGLREFLGTEGVEETYKRAAQSAEKLAEATEKVRQQTVATSAAMNELSGIQKLLNSSQGTILAKGGKDNTETLLAYYRELNTRLEELRTNEAARTKENVANLANEAIALKRLTEETIANEAETSKRAAEAQETARQNTEAYRQEQEALARQATDAQTLKEELSDLQSVLGSTLTVISNLKDTDQSGMLEQYRALNAQVQEYRMNAQARSEEGMRQLSEHVMLLKREANAAQDAEREKAAAAKKAEAEKVSAAKKAEAEKVAVAKRAEKEKENAAKQAAKEVEAADRQEVLNEQRIISLKAQISRWITSNGKAYKFYGNQIDAITASLNSMDARADETADSIAALRGQFNTLTAAAKESGLTGGTFFETFSKGIEKFGGWSLVTRSAMLLWQTIKDVYSSVKDLDAAMTELKKVTDLTDASYREFIGTASTLSQAIGATLTDTVNATADFARLGYTVDEATKLAEAALVYKNVGDGIDDISESTESLISTIKAFGISAEESMGIVDKYNEVGNRFAISSEGIGTALQKSASAMAAANNSFEETIALATAMNSVLQNPEVVGTAMKTVSMYLRAAKTEAEEAGESVDGMANSVSELRGELLTLTNHKVDIMIDDQNFKSTYQILKELSEVWEDLTDVDQSNILQLIGGKRNATAVTSLLTNFADAEAALATAQDAAGSALAENERYLDSIAGKLDVMQAKFETMSNYLLDSSTVKFVLDLVSGLMDLATWLSKIHALLPTIVASVAGIKGAIKSVNIHQLTSSIVAQRTEILQAGKVAQDYASKISALGKRQRDWVQTILANQVAAGKLTKEEYQQILATTGLTAAENAQTVAAKNLAATNTGLAASFKAVFASNPVGWILLAVSVAFEAIQALLRKTDEAIEKAHDIVSAYEEAQSTYKTNVDTLKDLSAEFEILSRGVDDNGKNVNLTNDEYNRYLSLVDQIVSISPEVVKGYDNEGTAIANYKTLLQDAIDVQDEWIKNQRAIKLASGEELFKGTAAELEQAEKKLRGSVWNNNTKNDTIADILNADSLDYREVQKKSNAWIGAFDELGIAVTTWEKMTTDSMLRLYEDSDKLMVLLRNSGAYTEEELSTIRTRLNALAEPYTKIVSIQKQQADYLQEWSKDQNWYKAIPTAALGEFNNGLMDVVSNSRSYGDALANTAKYGQQLSDVLSSDAAKSLEMMANGLKDTSISEGEAREELESYNLAVADFVNSLDVDEATLAAIVAYFESLSNKAVLNSAENVENLTNKLIGLSEVISALESRYKVFDTAQKEMEETGRLSASTIQAISKEVEDYTKFLYLENGLVKLNTQAWKEYANQDAAAEIEGINQQITALEQEQQKATDATRIKEIRGEIDALNSRLGITTAVYNELSGNGEDAFDNVSSAIDNVTGTIEAANARLATLVRYINIIQNYQQTKDAAGRIGFDPELDGGFGAYEDMIGLSEELGVSIDELVDHYDEWSDEIVALNGDINALEADLERLNRTAQTAGKTAGNTVALAINNVRNKVAVLSAAIREYQTNGFISSETYKTLSEDTVGFGDAVEFVNGKLTINIEKARSLVDKLAEQEAGTIALNGATADELELLYAISDAIQVVEEKTSNVTSDLDDLNKILGEMNEGTEYSTTAIITLLNKYPQLRSHIIETANGYKVETQAIQDLIQEKMKLISLNERETSINSARNSLLSKNNGSSTAIDKIDEAFAKFESVNGRVVSNMEDFAEAYMMIFDKEYDASTKYQEYTDYINALIAYKNNALEDSSIIEMIQNNGLKEGYTPEKTSSKSSSSTSTKEETAFEKAYKLHQHLLAMDQENVEEYLSWLEGAYKASYAAGEMELDDYYKYQEEVYEKTKELFNDSLDVMQHQIDLLGHSTSDTTDKQIAIYQQMQAAVHAQAEKYRKMGIDENDELIRQLQQQWWSYEESMRQLRESAFNDFLNDSKFAIDVLKQDDSNADKVVGSWKRILAAIHKEIQYYAERGYDTSSDVIQSLMKEAESAKEQIISELDEVVSKANEVLDGFQNVYTTLTDAASEYASTGYLSADSLQAILELGPKYLDVLMDENGQLVINEQSLQEVIKARTEEMAAETALNYAKQVLLATENDELTTLAKLTEMNASASGDSWDLAYQTLGLAKAIGTSKGIQEEYFDDAISYVTKMQSLTKTAVDSVSAFYETLNDGYVSQADGLDTILKLTQDMIKQENADRVSELEKEKKVYKDIIDQKKELLKLAKEQADHDRDMADKLKEIADLQSRIDQLALDDSREARAQRSQLEAELLEKQKALADDQADFAYDAQVDSLDKQYEAFEGEKDDEIDAQKNMLNSAEKLYQAAIARISNGWDTLYDDLLNWNYNYGSTLQKDLTNAWKAAKAAAERYGSFVSAMEGVKDHTNLGGASTTPNTESVQASVNRGAEAKRKIDSMRANSLAWFTAANPDEYAQRNAGLAKEYADLTGDKLSYDNGSWYKSDGSLLYELTHDEVGHAVVAAMKANSAAWNSASASERTRLSNLNVALAQRLSAYLGKSITRTQAGVWMLGDKPLYEVQKFHSGGIVGDGTPKQREVMALLEQGEAVLDKKREGAMYRIVDFVDVLSRKIGHAIDTGKLRSVLHGTAPRIPAFAIPEAIGGTSSSMNFNPNVNVVINHSGEMTEADARRYGAAAAESTLEQLKEAFTKRGVSSRGNSILK